jgi:hypothetical protein
MFIKKRVDSNYSSHDNLMLYVFMRQSIWVSLHFGALFYGSIGHNFFIIATTTGFQNFRQVVRWRQPPSIGVKPSIYCNKSLVDLSLKHCQWNVCLWVEL